MESLSVALLLTAVTVLSSATETQVKLVHATAPGCGRPSRGLPSLPSLQSLPAVGLSSACSGFCSVSSRLCRACCAAVASLYSNDTATLPAGGGSPSEPEQFEDFYNRAARCLSHCVNFTAKEVRDILQENRTEDIVSMAGQLDKALDGRNWTVILSSGRPASIVQLCERGDLDKC